MDSVIEQQRGLHEDIERYETLAVDLFLKDVKGHKANLLQQHRLSEIASRVLDRTSTLSSLYADANGTRASEIAALSGSGAPDDLDEFYDRLVRVKEYHRRNPDAPVDGLRAELRTFEEDEPMEGTEGDMLTSLFSGEENMGRFLDLHLSHEAYINLKGIPRRLNYLQYLDEFEAVDALPKEVKRSEAYAKYLTELVSYLESFFKRSRPLQDLEALEKEALESFDKQWEEGTAAGWPKEEPKANGKGKEEGKGIWDPVTQKFYTNENVYSAVKKSKKYQNALKRLQAAGAPTDPTTSAPSSDVASLRRSKERLLASQEALLRLLTTLLASVRSDTKSEVERRSALTSREREQELEEEEVVPLPEPAAEGAPGEDEDEGRIYNPLKLPMGWDGKPIPYWLYKLHGLGVEYRCEICSDYVYNGRKNFERHFQEARHAFGMKALGLPNTKHFHEITKIEDALALAEKLKAEGKAEIAASQSMEEVEDAEGNVYDRKTYEQLRKQGLV